MGDHKQLESQIREIIAAEQSASSLSEKLFSPTGLFSELAPLEEDRRTIVRSELFRTAQTRFRQLQQSEAAAFARAVAEAEDAFPSSGHRVKLEHVEST
jgi:hypothetical protein